MKRIGAVWIAAGLMPPEVTAAVKQAFRSAYNLDEKDALVEARRAVALGPNEPTAHRALASILWLDILFRRGAVVTDNYLGGGLKEQVALPKPPPELNDEFKAELAKAIALAEARVTQDPRSVQARFDAGTAYALQASYTATVEGSVLAAMRLAKHAYDYQEFVLAHDPKRIEAGLVVGTYRYLVSTLALPMRFMAYVAGFGGGKEHGIALIEAASHMVDTHVDAKVALLLIYNREGRFADAIRIAHELEEEFPRNRLLIMEQGSSEIRAGRAADADATLTRGLAAFDKDDRPKIPGERATWFYKRAVARVALRHVADARADLATAEKNQPADWVKGRLQLEVGRVADLSGTRAAALAAYRQARDLCAARNDVVCTAQADALLKQPFR
jgi:tetratricopeptide (TPR) repeat protein